MIHEEEPTEPQEDEEYDDVIGEAPPVDEYRLSTR
jgi:hypothetical protein